MAESDSERPCEKGSGQSRAAAISSCPLSPAALLVSVVGGRAGGQHSVFLLGRIVTGH